MTEDSTPSVKLHPIRVQLRRTKGWRKPPNTVVVARPSKWGNPWLIKAEGHCSTCSCGSMRFSVIHATDRSSMGTFETKDARIPGTGAAYWAMQGFRRHLWDSPDLLAAISELRGKNLACWCPLDQPCHADVLLDLANREVVY